MKNTCLTLSLLLVLATANAFAGDLITAIYAKDIVKVKTILSDVKARKAAFDEVDKDGYSAFSLAVRDNQAEIVREMIIAGADVNKPSGKLKLSPLHGASNIEVIRLLVNNKADVNAKDASGNSPLHSAVRNARIDVIKALIDSGAEVNQANYDGQTPIFLAATPEIAAMLQNAKANLNFTDLKGNNPLMTKISNRQTDTALWLISNHVSVEKANEEGDTPLHMAAKYGNDAVVKELLKNGAGVGAVNKKGDTPLHLAASAAVVDLLLKAGAVTDIVNTNKLIPIVAAAGRGNNEAAMAMMTKANVNSADENGVALMHSFAGRGNVEAIKKLIELGADVDIASKTLKQTPLHMASSKEAAEVLLNNGAKIDAADVDGTTPLMRALQNNNTALAEYYIQQKASVDLKDANGDNMLFFAKSAKTIELLLAADKKLLDGVNKAGETALFNAISDENKDAAIALINNGADINKVCNGTPVIHIAITKSEKSPVMIDVLKALLDKKPDVNILNDKKQAPITITRNTNIIILLAQNGADLTSKDQSGRTPLFYVVLNSSRDDEKKNAPDAIKTLLEKKADVNHKDFYGNTPIFYAPSVDVVNLLVNIADEKNRADVNITNNRGESLLYKAANDNKKELVKYYIDKKLPVNQATNNGDTPLHRAVTIIDPTNVERTLENPNPPAPHEIATMLIDAKADVNAKNNNGETPLFNARSASMITYLVKDCKADPNIVSTNGDTALMRIARTSLDAVNALINNGVATIDVNHANSSKKTAIFMAQNAGIVDVLVAAKADVNVKDTDGSTALHDAVKGGHADVVTALINAKADVTVRAKDGNLPLHLATTVEVANAILASPNADINAVVDTGKKDDVNSTGDTLLHISARKADGLKLVEMLMAKNASVLILNKKQETPLHLAASDAILLDMVKNVPTNINQKDIAGNTPLISMARLGNAGAVARLLELNADAKAKNSSNESALDFAPDLATATLLVAKGADIKQTDKAGMTPLLYAVKNNRYEVAEYLLKNGAPAVITVKGKTEAVKNNDSQNALHLCTSQKMFDLFSDKIGLNTTDNRGRTPLFYAAKNNNIEMVKYLLSQKGIIINCKVLPAKAPETTVKTKTVNPKSTNQKAVKAAEKPAPDSEEGLTPLHVTSDPIIAKLLIDTKKIDINDRTAMGYTPLMYSLASGGKIVQTLLDNGANVKIGNFNGMQPIHAAMNASIIDTLLKGGADINARDKTNSTPMHYAAQSYDVNWIKALIANKATINPVNNYGDSPMMLVRQPEVAKVLIDNGADVNAKNKMGYTKLHMAAAMPDATSEMYQPVGSSSPGMLDVLLAAPKINLNAASNSGATPLFLAANVTVAKKLVEKGASVIAKDKENATPLHYFAANGRKDMVEFVLAKLAELKNSTAINSLAVNNITPVYLATVNSRIDVLPLLIKAGADLDIPTVEKLGKSTPLMAAVNNNNIDVVKLIANAKGTDLNTKNISGLSPLHWASYKNYTKIMDILIDAHARVDITDNNNATPLFQAVSENHIEAVKLLLAAGATVNFKAKNNVTPLMVARSADIAALLIAKGASVNAVRSDMVTPLNLAIASGDDKMIQLMLNNQADIKAADKGGVTPLHLAIAKDMNDLARDLIARGATLNTSDKSGSTPLITAVQHGNAVIATELIKRGANPNAADNYGGTPIHYADKLDIIKVLITGGANLNAALKNGLAPMHLAVLQNNAEKINILAANGANINVETPKKVTPIMIAMNMKNTNLINLLKKLGATEPKPQPAPAKTGKGPAPFAPVKK